MATSVKLDEDLKCRVQSIGDYEKAEEEREFMRAVVIGMSDLEEGREVSFDDARTRLGLK